MSEHGGHLLQELYFIVKKHVDAKTWKFAYGDPFLNRKDAEEEVKHLENLTEIMVYEVVKFRPMTL